MQTRRCRTIDVVIHRSSDGIVVQAQASGFPITLRIPVQLKIPTMLCIGIEGHRQIPVIQCVLAIGLTKSLRLPVIEPTIIAKVVHGSPYGIKTGDVIVTSPHRDRFGGEFFIQRGFFHHKVDRPGRLGSVHQGRPTPNKLHRLHRIRGGKIIGLGISNHIRLNRNPVFQDLKTLQSVRIESAVRHARQRGVFLRHHQTRGRDGDLPPIVVLHLRQIMRINVRSSLSRIDPSALHVR